MHNGSIFNNDYRPGGYMGTHNPQKTIIALRDHLATHDAPIAFLFGAGTSSCVNTVDLPDYEPLIPAMEELSRRCGEVVAGLGEEFKAAWEGLKAECVKAGQVFNVETALTRVCGKTASMGEGDTSLGLSRDQLVGLDEAIRKKIGQEAVLVEEDIPRGLPHDAFAHWAKQAARTIPVEIFTTNYDILFERSLELARVPVFDGFTGSYRPFFNPECVDNDERLPGSETVRLWKMHGSVNWDEVVLPTGKRVVRGESTDTGKMILPTNRKYDESRRQPYVALMGRLERVLSRRGAILVIAGFSFGDQHINATIFEALDNHPSSHVIALCYGVISEDDAVVKAAVQRKNLMVLGSNAGVMGGILGDWRLPQPVDGKTSTFMDTLFDSDAAPGPDDVALTGKMRVGDFNRFAQFLAALAMWDSTTV